jgi:hypothetical protein
MYHSKAKSKFNISLQEAILNLSNNNYTSRNIAENLSKVFAKKNRTKLCCKSNSKLERNVFMFDRRKT